MKKFITPQIRDRVGNGLVWDAFCGGLAMSEALGKTGSVLSSDACVPLIALYRGLLDGWRPAAQVTREVYESAKALPDTDPMKGFCGFGCSFGGMYFSSYVQPEATLTVKSGPSAGNTFHRRYHAATLDVLTRQLRAIAHRPVCVDFLDVPPQAGPAAVYCDPPYRGTVGYAGVPAFDHDAFYRHCAAWSKHCPVFISEYECPIGVCILDVPAPRGCTMAKADARERLYYIAKGSL